MSEIKPNINCPFHEYLYTYAVSYIILFIEAHPDVNKNTLY